MQDDINELLFWNLKNIRSINQILKGDLSDDERLLLIKVKNIYIRNYYYLQQETYHCKDLLK